MPNISKKRRQLAVQRQLDAQNALHGAMADAWLQMGGMKHLVAWGKKNPTTFYKEMFRMSPGLIPTAGMQGDVNITIHNNLGRTELDGPLEAGSSVGTGPVEIEGEAEVIE